MTNKTEVIEEICGQYQQDKFAMYLRKSRADLELEAMGEGETLARHRKMLYDLAAKHDIHPDQITVYHEMVSGESISERPEVQRLLNDLYQKKYKGVLVVEVERLARGNTKDQGEVSDAFQYSHTQIITPSKTYNPDNEFDQEYFEFGLFMSRREYKTIKRRMEAGRMQSIQEGNYVGSLRPYGYNIERINKKERILVPHPIEAPIVQMMFDWFTVDRQTCGWIARKLTEMQIPTLTGNKEWNKASVKDMLQNVHYAGKVRWGRRRCSKEFDTEKGKLSKTKRRNTPDDYKEYPGKHKALITQEQFDLAQTLFVGQVPVKANETIVNPLARLLYCKDCGKRIALQRYDHRKGKTTPRYIHGDSTLCGKKSLPKDQVLATLVEALNAYISDFTIKMENDQGKADKAEHSAHLAVLEAELAKLERKRRRLFDAYEEDEAYTKEEFIERKQMVNSDIDRIKKQIQETKQAVPEPVDYVEKISTLHRLIAVIQDEDMEPKAQNDFLKAFIEKIEYDAIDYGRQKGGKAILDIHLK